MNDIKKNINSKLLKNNDFGEKIIPFFGVFGIFIGVFSIIFVMSVMRGFQEKLVNRIIGTQAHLYISSTQNKQVLNDWEKIKNNIKNDSKLNESLVSPYIEIESISVFNNLTFGSIIFATNKQFLKNLFKNTETKIQNDLNEREVYIGNQFSIMNDVFIDDTLNFISAWDLIKSKVPQQRKFMVKGILKTGSYARDLKYVYMDIKDATKYFSLKKGYPSGLALLFKNPDNVDKYKKYFLNKFDNIQVQTWKERNQKMFYSLKLERFAMLFTLIFIIIIASFSIISSLVLVIESKSKEFAILFSMGLKKQVASKVLFLLSLKKGVIGALSGGALAWLSTYLIKEYNLISLPDIYYDHFLPVKIDVTMNILVIFLSILLCVLGSVYPIRKMKSISIINNIRKN